MSVHLNVICYSGYKVDELPVRFFLGKRKVEIREVVDRWLGQDHHYFKVVGDDGAIYILRHNTETDTWELTLFDNTRSQNFQLNTLEN